MPFKIFVEEVSTCQEQLPLTLTVDGICVTSSIWIFSKIMALVILSGMVSILLDVVATSDWLLVVSNISISFSSGRIVSWMLVSPSLGAVTCFGTTTAAEGSFWAILPLASFFSINIFSSSFCTSFTFSLLFSIVFDISSSSLLTLSSMIDFSSDVFLAISMMLRSIVSISLLLYGLFRSSFHFFAMERKRFCYTNEFNEFVWQTKIIDAKTIAAKAEVATFASTTTNS